MTEDEKQAQAARLLGLVVQDPEYSFVYEDEELSSLPEDTQREIHELMCSAQIYVGWPGSDELYQVAGEEEEE